jgi:hypothetical protein
MKNNHGSYVNIDEYIADFPNDVQEIVEKIRSTIKKSLLKPRKQSSATSGFIQHLSGNYGFINKISTKDGTGIPGGIGGGEGYDSHTVFYVGVENVKAALLKAERLGGHIVMGPIEKPGGSLLVAHFKDPEGNLIGLAGPS